MKPSEFLRRWMQPQLPVFLVLLAAVALAPVFSGLRLEPVWTAIPLLFSAVLFGLPHGALDDRVLFRLFQIRAGAWLPRLAVYAGYVAVALAYLVAWFAQPAFAFLFFIAMTWFHWGQGDVYFLRHIYRAPYLLHSRTMCVLSGFIRGGLPMFVTFIFHPSIYLDVAAWCTRIFPGGRALPDFFYKLPVFAPAAFPAFLFFVGIYLLAAAFRSPPHNRVVAACDAGEILLLLLLFIVLHPLVAIGIYFCIWHGLRHLVRLQSWMRSDSIPGFSLFPASVLLKSIPNTAISILALLVVTWVSRQAFDSWQDLIGAYLVLIAVLTLPHLGVVTWMDARESTRKGRFFTNY